MPTIRPNMINKLINEAEKSPLKQSLAAAIVQNTKFLSDSCCNIDRNFCRGHYTPSLHAEARAILNYFGKNVFYDKCNGWRLFYNSYQKHKKIDLIVIRTKRDGSLANARPCRMCLKMMKDLGIKKVHYTTGNNNEIITETVKNMISIQESSSFQRYFKVHYNYPQNKTDYYKTIISRHLPVKAKKENIDIFSKLNLDYIIPQCIYQYSKQKNKTFFEIIDNETVLAKIIVI